MKPLYVLLPLAAILSFTACREEEEEPCDPAKEHALAQREAELDRREADLIARERALGMGYGTSGSASYNGGRREGANPIYVDGRTRSNERGTGRSRRVRTPEDERVAYQKPMYFPGQFPEASERVLTIADLEQKSAWGKKVMMNEIYARYGLIFTEPDLRKHFNGESWYKGTRKNVDNNLTPIERQNIAFIEANM